MPEPVITVTALRTNRKRLSRIIFTTTLAMTSAWAMATNADMEQPILIDSASQNLDLKNSITTFSKNVSVIQGSLSIKADVLKAYRQNQKGSEVFVATGSPATYQQRLDDGNLISAEAETIRYEVFSRTLILTGHAQLKQNDSLVRGKTIRYDLGKQELFAEGTDADPTTTIFNPKQDTLDQPQL